MIPPIASSCSGEAGDRGDTAVTFKKVLGQVVDWLQQDSHVAYPALKRQFDLDDNDLADLKEALAFSHPLRLELKQDEVWSGPESDQRFPQSHDLRRIERYTLGVSSDCLRGGVEAWVESEKRYWQGILRWSWNVMVSLCLM